MSYLSVRKFWDYQNADVWKKSKGHPPWFKFFVHRDREIDELPLLARLLWYELLAAASRNGNVLKANLSESERDLKWICSEVRMEPEVVAEMLPLLVKGRWLSQTETSRRSRKRSRKNRDDCRALIEEEEIYNPPDPPSSTECPVCHLDRRTTAALADHLRNVHGIDNVTELRKEAS